MKILAIESSGLVASCVIVTEETMLAEYTVNFKKTHSQTLLPMVDEIVSMVGIELKEIDAIAVSAGPGSFTGIRIGISALKGLAAASKKLCVGVSTLSAMAQNFSDTDCIICAVMDARCNQVYNALFDINNGEIKRLCEDRAIMCDELACELKKISENSDKPIIIVGDGAEIFSPFAENISGAKKADIKRRYQNAVGVGFAAYESFLCGDTLSPEELLPLYLRLPQAERELKLKKGE